MMHTAWRIIEEVPYCFSRSSMKFLGDTGCKIDDLNPIRVRLQGQSQLSNPSYLPCFIISYILYSNNTRPLLKLCEDIDNNPWLQMQMYNSKQLYFLARYYEEFEWWFSIGEFPLQTLASLGTSGWLGTIAITWHGSVDKPNVLQICGWRFGLKSSAQGSKCPIKLNLCIDVDRKSKLSRNSCSILEIQ